MENTFMSGLIAAPFTPMDDDGTVNLDPVQKYAEALISNDVTGVFVCGTTGEGATLSLQEKKEVLDEWVRCSDGRLKIIMHVGDTSPAQSIALAKYSVNSGADAIAAVPPYYYKPNSAEDLLQYFKPIAAAAPKLPFYYYNIPSFTGVEIPVNDLLENAADEIPNFAGVKFTHNDLVDLQRCIAMDDGRYQVLFGSDEILLCGLTLGAIAAVGSTYNYMAPVYNDLIKAFEIGDLKTARELQQFSVKVVGILNRHGGGIRVGKAIMAMIGIDCGPCRLPISETSDSEKAEIRQELLDVGFFDILEYDEIRAS